MRTNKPEISKPQISAKTDVTENSSLTLSTSTHPAEMAVNPVAHKSYHELADRPVVEVDALNQLHANLAQLEDLQARLGFVMREVRYLLKA